MNLNLLIRNSLGMFLMTLFFFGNQVVLDSPKVYAAQNLSGAKAEVSLPVSINTAGMEELQAVRGIGPATAERIIHHRNEFGPFESPDDLAAVRGIGGAKLQKIRSQITV